MLEENNLNIKNIVKTTIFLQDINDFKIINEVY
ncbi:hypothetical protein HOG21_00995 [bacterium]|nr:hypothetical protein [bacterium]